MNKTGNDSAQIEYNEYTAKKFLHQYGIPIVSERIADNPSDAVAAARQSGFPVVLKGLGSSLLHKTERGIVHLSLQSPEDVQKAAQRILDEVGKDLDGFLVQPHILGRREFVAGLFRDPQFGPVIMFGVGGVFTEAYSDVAFRLAPLSKNDIADMLAEIKGKALLGDFRGEMPVRQDQIIDTLMGLSRIGESHPEISEIDINPLIATPQGQIVAVDALVITGANIADNFF